VENFDVVVVGGRCAGSSLAIRLARRGMRVCVLDRARFPSETPSTHVIQPCGVRILAELGVLDQALAAGAVPIDRFTLVNEDVRIDAVAEPQEFGAPGLCLRRLTLDALLVRAAAAAGAEVRTGCRVRALITAGGRVVGVSSDRGPVHARLVVGADGRHSTVASRVRAVEYHVTPAGRMPAWAYYEGVDDTEGRLRLARRGELAFLASPTDGGLYLAGVAPAVGRREEFARDRDRQFTQGLATWPELADLLAGARRVGPIRLMTDWHGYFRQSAGPGWVLVGDAGHFKDFTPAQGISDALRQARQLAPGIERGLGATGSIDTEMLRWWQWRDGDAYEMYWFANDLGAPGRSSPLITRVLRDIAASRDATMALLRVLNHDQPPAQLLTPGRLAASALRALRDRPDQVPATLTEIAAVIRDEVRRARRRRLTPPGTPALASSPLVSSG
jgi:2-polyprenyl-6-methoxyphenol hydroxylase-like FAD-dependent oxidoreductase